MGLARARRRAPPPCAARRPTLGIRRSPYAYGRRGPSWCARRQTIRPSVRRDVQCALAAGTHRDVHAQGATPRPRLGLQRPVRGGLGSRRRRLLRVVVLCHELQVRGVRRRCRRRRWRRRRWRWRWRRPRRRRGRWRLRRRVHAPRREAYRALAAPVRLRVQLEQAGWQLILTGAAGGRRAQPSAAYHPAASAPAHWPRRRCRRCRRLAR